MKDYLKVFLFGFVFCSALCLLSCSHSEPGYDEIKEENEKLKELIDGMEQSVADYYIAHRILMNLDSVEATSDVKWYQDKYKYRFYLEPDGFVFDCLQNFYIGIGEIDTALVWELRLDDILWEKVYMEQEVMNKKNND